MIFAWYDVNIIEKLQKILIFSVELLFLSGIPIVENKNSVYFCNLNILLKYGNT